MPRRMSPEWIVHRIPMPLGHSASQQQRTTQIRHHAEGAHRAFRWVSCVTSVLQPGCKTKSFPFLMLSTTACPLGDARA